jgi:hypothetical protein
MIDPTPLPGLSEHTIVVVGAGSDLGAAAALTLVASGARVLATDGSATLPKALVDAGTGLPGELHYKSLDVSSGADWAAVSDWIGEQSAGIHGIADLAAGHDGLTTLAPHLLDGGSVVRVGPAERAESNVRSNTVAPHPDSEPLAVAAAVAFLLSDLGEFCDGAVIPIRERPAPAI